MTPTKKLNLLGTEHKMCTAQYLRNNTRLMALLRSLKAKAAASEQCHCTYAYSHVRYVDNS